MKKIFFTLVCLSFLTVACLPKSVEVEAEPTEDKVIICPKDIKACSNGNYVPRIAPDCNFDSCSVYYDVNDPRLALGVDVLKYEDSLLQIETEEHHSFRDVDILNHQLFNKGAECFDIGSSSKAEGLDKTKEFIIAKSKIIFESGKHSNHSNGSGHIMINNQKVDLDKNQIKAVAFKNLLLLYIGIDDEENVCISQGVTKLIHVAPEEDDDRFLSFPENVPGITIEVSTYPPGSKPTAEQQQAADELFEKSLASAKKNGWFNFDNAVEDGYKRFLGNKIHFFNLEYFFDDEILNPEKPEMLVYYETEKGLRLGSFMYTVRTVLERGPQIGGPLTVWHYHTVEGDNCLEYGVKKACPKTKDNLFRTGEMIHVWFVDHRDGPFGTRIDLKEQALNQLLDPKFDQKLF